MIGVTCVKNNAVSTSIADKINTNSIKESAGSSSNSNVTNNEDEYQDFSSQKFIRLVTASNVQYKSVIDVHDEDCVLKQ